MTSPNRYALPVQEVAQHLAARERIVEMQLVELAHGTQILGRGRPRFVVDGAQLTPSASAYRDMGKSCSRSIIAFALGNPALVSAPSKKYSKVSSPILA